MTPGQGDIAKVEAYLAGRPEEQRTALQHLREVIRAAAPDAVEVMSYGIPAFRAGLKGKVIVGYAGMKAHCGLYVLEGDLVARFAARA